MNTFSKIPFPEYLALPYMSVSGLKLYDLDPIAYLLSFQKEKDKSTPALDMGKAVHCRILEPEAYLSTVAQAPDISKVSKVGKAYWVEFNKGNEGKVALDKDTVQAIEYMAASVKANPEAMALLDGGKSEMSGIWKDPRGFTCKMRADSIKIDEYNGIIDITDLKTFIGDLGGYAVGKEITNRMYHWQDIFYCKGAKAIYGLDQARFNFIFVGKQWPYRSRVFTINKDKIMTEAGERIEGILDSYARFLDAPIEALFSRDDSEIIYLPPWAA